MAVAGFLGGLATSFASQLAGPIVTQTMSNIRDAAGFNDIATARELQYRLNQGSTTPQANSNYTPIRFNCEQAILAFNQAPWHLADGDVNQQRRFWERLKSNLRFQGVRLDIDPVNNLNNQDDSWQGQIGREWARMIDMSSEGPNLGLTMRNYYRSRGLDEALRNVSEPELRYQLQRATIRRQADRDQLMHPFYGYDHADAYRLWWMGIVDRPTRQSILEASGCVRAVDQEYMDHLTRRLPGYEQLIHWAEQGLWNDQNAARLGLDAGWNASPIPSFFMKAQGIGVNDLPLPGEPEGEKDWIKLLFRSTRKVPSYAEAQHLQWRLRPSGNNDGLSIIPEVAEWTPRHTLASLIHAGIPEPIAKQLTAIDTKPMEMDFIGETISQALEHPSVMRLKRELFGPGYQWLIDQLKDHGFDEKWAKLGTEVVVQIARGKAMAEKNAKQKSIRQEARDGLMKAYEQGTILKEDVIEQTTSRQFSARMAEDECYNIDEKVHRQLEQLKIDAIKDAYFNGNMPQQRVEQELTAIVINPGRAVQYMDAWLWERTSKAKGQTTSEILNMLKAGLNTPAQAIMRLTNLGWKNPDAIAEVALVQHEMLVSQAKLQAAQQAHRAALIQAEAHRVEIARQKAQKEAQRLAKAQATIDKQVAKANHKRLLHESDYYAKVHKANARYAAAEKVGNQDLMDAEIQTSQVAYQRWLLNQIELLTQAPEVANVVGQLQTEPTPNTGQGEGTTEPPSDDEPPSVKPTEPDSGTPTEDEPEQALPEQ